MCPETEHCNHYANGTRQRDQFHRLKVPCRHWVNNDCDLGLLDPNRMGPACNIADVRRKRDAVQRRP